MCWLIFNVLFVVYAGRKNLVFRAKYTNCKTEQQSDTTLMDLKEEFQKEIRNAPYPHIEPYSTGMLKVSDLHSIYWEQSGNPDGHVGAIYKIFLNFFKCIQLYMYLSELCYILLMCFCQTGERLLKYFLYML